MEFWTNTAGSIPDYHLDQFIKHDDAATLGAIDPFMKKQEAAALFTLLIFISQAQHMNIPCQPQITVVQQWKTYLKWRFPTETLPFLCTLGKQMVPERQTSLNFSLPATLSYLFYQYLTVLPQLKVT